MSNGLRLDLMISDLFIDRTAGAAIAVVDSPDLIEMRKRFQRADKAARAGRWAHDLTVDRAIAYLNLLSAIQAKRAEHAS